jgi:hypothetical protein
LLPPQKLEPHSSRYSEPSDPNSMSIGLRNLLAGMKALVRVTAVAESKWTSLM